MPAKWKPTCPWIKKEQAAHKRALWSYQPVPEPGEPYWRKPYWATNSKLFRAMMLYAVALGRKRGQLPKDSLAGFSAWMGKPEDGRAIVTFAKVGGPPIQVFLRNLDAWPAPAVDLTETTHQHQEAAAMPMAA